jgi:hypothetical protein
MKKIFSKTVSVWCNKRQRYVTESSEYTNYSGAVSECKSFFSSKKAPAAPPPPAPKTVQDLINGVETVTETRDGKEYIVTRQLPLTPEQQAYKDDITKRLDNIDRISQGIAVLNPDYKPMVDALRTWQQQTRGQLFGEATRAQQDELTRRGLGNSTAAANASLQLGRQMGEQVQADEVNLFGLAEQQRTADLQRATSGLALRSDVNQTNLQNLSAAGQATAGRQESRLSLDSQMQQQQYQNQITAFQNQRPSLASQLAGVAVQAGMAYATGGMSLGGSLGSAAASSAMSPGISSSSGGRFGGGFSITPGGTQIDWMKGK